MTTFRGDDNRGSLDNGNNSAPNGGAAFDDVLNATAVITPDAVAQMGRRLEQTGTLPSLDIFQVQERTENLPPNTQRWIQLSSGIIKHEMTSLFGAGDLTYAQKEQITFFLDWMLKNNGEQTLRRVVAAIDAQIPPGCDFQLSRDRPFKATISMQGRVRAQLNLERNPLMLPAVPLADHEFPPGYAR
jgi:hypothetical protein